MALKLAPLDIGKVAATRWGELAQKNDARDVDGVFLSCTNTRQIEAIADIEPKLGKPAVNSNRAVLWGRLRELGAALVPLPAMPELGRLMERM